jgi:hypothetical protein
MTKKYKHSIDTLEGTIEGWSDIPPTTLRPPRKTPEEGEVERKRLYPDTSKASYLQYPCYYCGNEFYLKNPNRGPNINPLSDGFILTTDDNNKRLMPTCRVCVLEMSRQNEEVSFKRHS